MFILPGLFGANQLSQLSQKGCSTNPLVMDCQIAKGHTLWKDVNSFEKQKMAEPQAMIYNDAIHQAIFKAYTLHYITLHMRELHPSRMRVYQLWVFTSARMGESQLWAGLQLDHQLRLHRHQKKDVKNP
jgi:hypothetical protein